MPTILIVLASYAGIAKKPTYSYDYNENCNLAYQYSMSMRFDAAREIIAIERKANPDNLMAPYLADYEDCITLLLNADKDEYERRKKHFDERLDLLEKGDEKSPWFRLCKAGLYMHWAMAGVQFGDQLKAAVRFRKSFLLLKENERLFPEFEYNHIFTGLQESVVGALPGNYQWIASLFGISGSIKKGNAQLAAFVNSHNENQPLYAETVLYLSYTRFYLGDGQKETWDYLNKPQFTTSDNLLHTFMKTNLSIDYHKAGVALETLKDAETGAAFDKYPIFFYMKAVAMLAKSDIGCISYFEQYLKKNKSDFYIKTSWQKMAFAWYLAGNMEQATYCKQQAKIQGTTRLDADKQAQKFAETKEWPQKNLLRGRLLADGGFYNDAFTELSGVNLSGLSNPADEAEYFYRLGRVYQELSDNNHALEYYNYAIAAGKKRHEQFAARAVLQSGQIYEHTGRPALALARYKECLDMPAHDFQNAIDQQAKAGINRVEDSAGK